MIPTWQTNLDECKGLVTNAWIQAAMQAEIDGLRAENESMRSWFIPAECESLKRDAERYRWLRDPKREGWVEDGIGPIGRIDSIFICERDDFGSSIDGEELDAAIDAEMGGS